MHKFSIVIALASVTAFSFNNAIAAGVAGEIEEVMVSANTMDDELSGKTEAASVGTVLAEQIEHRPVLRPAEILETIPGMVITQHSGGGKANQYFLRGFNLDHSTDFASYIEGAPVNNVTHGHGQGYTDLNFLVPELLDKLVYKKGPYYASSGDFSSAGSAQLFYANQKDSNKITLTLAEDNYQRLLFVGGTAIGAEGNLVYGIENLHDDGPWSSPEDLNKDNALLKYIHGDNDSGFSVSALYYSADWDGTDQIPERLVANGTLDRYDTLDETTGGDTHRYQLALQHWAQLSDGSRVESNLYAIDYELDLYSNFTYFLRDPIRGDLPGSATKL